MNKKLKDFYETIKDNIYNIIKWPLKKLRYLKYSISNLIRWFPVIWSDRDWDHIFILEILKFKLKNTEHMFRRYGNHVDSEKDANKVHKAVLLLDRILNDKYYENTFKHHDIKWGNMKMSFEDIKGSEFTSLNITRPNIKTKEDEVQENKEYKKLLVVSDKLKEQDYRMLFNHLNKYIESWWD